MVRYLISSHVRYAPTTLPRLLPELLAQIEPEHLVVVIGGADRDADVTHAGIRTLEVTHNSFDYTGPIAVLEHGLESDWWFWLHDTCRVGPRFREKVEAGIDPQLVMKGAGWHSAGMPFANLGLYAQTAFERARDGLLALKDCSKLEACGGDGVVWRANDGQGRLYGLGEVTEVALQDEYGTGTLRKTSYIPAVDLYKIQANWGQGGEIVDP